MFKSIEHHAKMVALVAFESGLIVHSGYDWVSDISFPGQLSEGDRDTFNRTAEAEYCRLVKEAMGK